jgi:hypothetical protein
MLNHVDLSLCVTALVTVLVAYYSGDVTVPLYIKRTSALHSDDADGTQ